jgi:glutamyl-tRNA reductase
MSLLVVGVNHRTAPVSLREKVFFDADRLPDALRDLCATDGVHEAVIVSTCNRTEIYCSQFDSDLDRPGRWLARQQGLCETDLTPYLFGLTEGEGVRHLLRVACGLDSMVLGEPQILGQIKDAYRAAVAHRALGRLLNRLFQHAFQVAKQVRTDTAIGTSPVSVAFATVRLAEQIFGDLGRHTALLIGAGDTIALVARHLHERGTQRIIVANRTLERAQCLAVPLGGYAIPLSQVGNHLKEADIVVTATSSAGPVLDRAVVERALRARKHRPMFLVDIAVPRDIDPTVGGISDVYLYTVDDLESVIQDNLHSRQIAARQADEIITSQVHCYMDWVGSLDAVAVIRAIRARADARRERVLVAARRRLALGDDPRDVLEQLARRLTNTLIHPPSAKLRAADNTDREALIKAARDLFGVD